MREALGELLSSKKFLVGISSSIAALVIRLSSRFGWGIDAETASQLAWTVVALASTYLGAQGLADHGKEAAAVRAEADAPSAPSPLPVVPPKAPPS